MTSGWARWGIITVMDLAAPPLDSEPAPSAMRRALRRARDGLTLDVTEAAVLLAARGEDLRDLTALAAARRDARLVDEGRPGVVTYSRKVFVPLTRLCRDRCHYCTFVTVPGRLRAAGEGMFLDPDEVIDLCRRGAEAGCKEALFTLGDRPEDRWPEAGEWLASRGFSSTLDYVRAMAIRVLEETGLLPHLNPGVMSWSELSTLKPVAPSMGMMLETTATRLFTTPGQCHHGSPDKDPAVRLRTLTDAGRLAVPFTSGILVGIGENRAERAESLLALAGLAREFGHLQEVIVQNFRAKPDTAMRGVADAGRDEFLAAIAVARLVLDPRVAVQAPPNLVDRGDVLALLAEGVADHQVQPMTVDWYNVNNGRRGSTVLTYNGINEGGPATLNGTAQTGAGQVLMLLQGGVTTKLTNGGTSNCVAFPTVGTALVP